MIAAGDREVEILDDGWTAVTRDRSLAAHYEDTVALTERGRGDPERAGRGRRGRRSPLQKEQPHA